MNPPGLQEYVAFSIVIFALGWWLGARHERKRWTISPHMIRLYKSLE